MCLQVCLMSSSSFPSDMVLEVFSWILLKWDGDFLKLGVLAALLVMLR